MTAPLSPEKLNEIKALLDKMPPESWAYEQHGISHQVWAYSLTGWKNFLICEYNNPSGWQNTAIFIAASRQNIPALVAEVERLQAKEFAAQLFDVETLERENQTLKDELLDEQENGNSACQEWAEKVDRQGKEIERLRVALKHISDWCIGEDENEQSIIARRALAGEERG